jgi:hypothetical protein
MHDRYYGAAEESMMEGGREEGWEEWEGEEPPSSSSYGLIQLRPGPQFGGSRSAGTTHRQPPFGWPAERDDPIRPAGVGGPPANAIAAAPFLGHYDQRNGNHHLRSSAVRSPSSPHAPTHRRRAPLSRWIFVYIPAALFVGLVVYVICELAMKHLALSNLQAQLRALPELPDELPLPPAVVAATTAASHAAPSGGIPLPLAAALTPQTVVTPPPPLPLPPPTPPSLRPPSRTKTPASDVSFAMRTVIMRPRPRPNSSAWEGA